jgi:hypothetical protein
MEPKASAICFQPHMLEVVPIVTHEVVKSE